MTYVLPFEGVALKRHYLKHCNFYENKYTIFGIQTLWLKKSYRKKKSRVEIYLPWSDPSGNSSMHPKGSPLPTLESTVFKVRKKKKALIILVKQRLLYKTQEQETRIFSDWLQGSTEGPGLKGEAGIDSPPTSAPLLSYLHPGPVGTMPTRNPKNSFREEPKKRNFCQIGSRSFTVPRLLLTFPT